jgi:hypothetical protein
MCALSRCHVTHITRMILNRTIVKIYRLVAVTYAAAARRALPGHLLRRCQILSSLRIGNVCQQRVAVTGMLL